MDRRQFVRSVGSGLFLAVSSHAGQVWAGGEELAVVVGPKSSVSGLSFYELKQLYMGERLKTPTGEWMVPLNRKKDTSERIGFDDSVLGMSPDVVGSYWIDRKIRGQSGPPKAIASAALILKLVEKVPGAIGYVALSEAKDVKIVKIDGKLPGQSGYGIGT